MTCSLLGAPQRATARVSALGPGADPRLEAVCWLYSQADTLLILPVFSVHGCRFCRANRELFCRQSGSGVTGWLMVFWKASCCSCIRIRFACCRSASRSSAVCRLHHRQETPRSVHSQRHGGTHTGHPIIITLGLYTT